MLAFYLRSYYWQIQLFLLNFHYLDLVELGGIEPPSNAESPRLLRAQSVQTFYSAPTFVTDT